MGEAELTTLFGELRELLQPYAAELLVKEDKADVFYLDAAAGPVSGKQTFFGMVQVKKAYVAYHLMPVYIFPDLLDSVSPELRKRMQGKSCFSFKRSDPALFTELAALTRAGFERYAAEGYRQ